jgi:hypothetical protein
LRIIVFKKNILGAKVPVADPSARAKTRSRNAEEPTKRGLRGTSTKIRSCINKCGNVDLKRKNIAGEGFASLAHRMLWCQLRKARFEALPEALGQRKPLFGSATKKNAEKKMVAFVR